MKDENLKRQDEYRNDPEIEKWIRGVNDSLAKISRPFARNISAPSEGSVFIVGLQRSGTTLLMQMLCRAFEFTYPDNIVARFWKSPWVGVAVSRSLKEQLGIPPGEFDSDYGVTSNIFGPHEFGYFWTDYFGFRPTHQLSEEQLDTVDIAGLRADMGMMERVGKNPLLFKAVPLSLNIDFLAEHCPKAKFIYLERDLLYIAQSTYQARMDRYGDARQWWSLKPAEYEQLRQKKPLQQIVGQIHCCSRRLLHCLEKIPPEKRLHLTYKGLCESPRQKLECIAEFMGRTCDNNAVPESFSHRNVRQLDTDLFCKLQGYFDGDEFQT